MSGRRVLALSIVTSLLGSLTLLGLSLVTASPAAAVPGQPGTPSPATVLYQEDFENTPAVTDLVGLEGYQSTQGVSYTADPDWLNVAYCNGLVTTYQSVFTGSPCTQAGDVQIKAYALGLLNSPQNPTTNRAVSTNTAGPNIGPNQRMFQSSLINVPAAGRFITFSVDTAASACFAAQPALNFFLLTATGQELPVSTAPINPCTAPDRQTGIFTYPDGTVSRDVSYGRFAANSSILFNSNQLSVVLRNGSGAAGGNDGAFDNIRILDVTPQLDKAFSPATVPAGSTSTLTLTVTNTEELAAKNGWSYTDTLPAGLVLASPTGLVSTCDATVSAADGGTSIAVTNGNLAAGQVSCTVSVQVTSAQPSTSDPAQSASFTNGPGNVTSVGLNPPNPATVTFTRTPGISIVKSATPTTLTAAGQPVAYSFLVTNTGTTDLTDVTVAETAFSGTGEPPVITCPAGTTLLVPAASITCTATYVATQADVDAGEIDNTAVATGTAPNGSPITSSPSSAEVLIPATPAVDIVKSASPSDEASFVVGQVVTYSFVVSNIGNVTLTDVAVDEGVFTGSGDLSTIVCPAGAASMAPGAQITCTATYTLTQADVDAGEILNDATATGTPPVGPPVTSPPSEVTIPAPFDPALTVDKSADVTQLTVAGQTVNYSFLVTNTGNVTLSAITIADTDFTGTGTLSPIVCPPASVIPGATTTCTASYVVTQADIDAGGIENTATASGTPPTGPPVTSPPDTVDIPALSDPSIAIVKSADPSDEASFVVGQVVTYSFVVTNTGNVTLSDVAVDEGVFTGSGDLSAVTCPSDTLAPGTQVTCTATYTLTQADVDAGEILNDATSTGTPPVGPPVTSPPSEVTIPAPQDPALTIDKTADRTELTAAGQIVNYSFLVTNTGNLTLTDVVVAETSFTGSGTAPVVSCPAGAASLAPGAFVTCTATYVATQADIDNGGVANTAVATGTTPSGTPVDSPPDSVEIPAVRTPGIALVKSATPEQGGTVGEVITYDFLVTNTGNVTLTDVVVDEGEFTGTGELSDIVCPAGAAALAPGAALTCTADYTLTQADVDNGQVTNTATATGTPPADIEPPTSPPSTVTVPIPPAPGISIVKSADVTDPDDFQVGATVTYSFVVTNTGNVTLTDVVVNEGEFTGSGELSDIACPAEAASLPSGAQIICSATYVLTQADVDAGEIVNDATAAGTPPTGPSVESPPSEVTIPAPRDPALDLVKTADLTRISTVGQTVTYSFLVTNTGNVTLDEVVVNEAEFSGTGELSAITCPGAPVTLVPGQQVVCTATYEVTQGDLNSGQLTNTATATGTPPGDGEAAVSPPSTVTVPGDPRPALTLVKTADTTLISRAGQSVTYSFVVTNTGNVTLDGVRVDEVEFSGTGTLSAVTCPGAAAALAPGTSVTCTATYTVTTADVTHGMLTNTATATGTPRGGDVPVVSTPSTAQITVAVTGIDPPVVKPPLAHTGLTALPQMLLAGLGLLILGGGSLIATQRRRRQNG